MNQRRADNFCKHASWIGAALLGVSGLVIGVSLRPVALSGQSSTSFGAAPTLFNATFHDWFAVLAMAVALGVLGWLVLRALSWCIVQALPNRSRKAAAQNKKAIQLRDLDDGAQNIARAFKLFEAAAEAGDVNAQLNLGCLYGTGRGVLKDEVMCYAWWSLAASMGSSRARRGCSVLDRRLSAADLNNATVMAHKLRELVRTVRSDSRVRFS